MMTTQETAPSQAQEFMQAQVRYPANDSEPVWKPEATGRQADGSASGIQPQNGFISPTRAAASRLNAPKSIFNAIKWGKFRSKATLLALSIGIIPLLVIGSTAYFAARRVFTLNAVTTEQSFAVNIEEELEHFLEERLQDLRIMASLDIFTTPAVRDVLTREEKNAALDIYIKQAEYYDSIAVFDLQGNVLFQSAGTAVEKPQEQTYFQYVLQHDGPFISEPYLSVEGGVPSFYMAAPIKDIATGKTIALIRARVPLAGFRDLLNFFTDREHGEFYLLDVEGTIYEASEEEYIGRSFEDVFPALAAKVDESEIDDDDDENLAVDAEIEAVAWAIDIPGGETESELAAYLVPDDFTLDEVDLLGGVVSATKTNLIFEPLRRLLTLLGLGTALTTVSVGAIAVYIATRVTRPILEAADTVTRLGQGDLSARLTVRGDDELAVLGANVNFMADHIQALLATQAETTHRQSELAEQERQRSESLQRDLLQLLEEIENASQGDLTVRAELTAGDIGIIGDVFNSIIESLRKIVVQVKQATGQVNTSLSDNEKAIQQLADEAVAQMDEISTTQNSVEHMSLSIQAVANNARQAAEVARIASTTAQESGIAMDQTVESIFGLRSTVAETTKKVKQLGEASQQISQVILLINEIALKTNLLAVNASIEAAHAGDEGQGFAVVANEVGQLAEQSAAATKEIEHIVKTIQIGAREVVEAMETGTVQVVEGTQQVQNTKQSLRQILNLSQQIDQFLQSISAATISQAETSQTVTHLMQQITQASQRTSNSSRQVAVALQNTVEVAQALESTVEQFDVGVAV